MFKQQSFRLHHQVPPCLGEKNFEPVAVVDDGNSLFQLATVSMYRNPKYCPLIQLCFANIVTNIDSSEANNALLF